MNKYAEFIINLTVNEIEKKFCNSIIMYNFARSFYSNR